MNLDLSPLRPDQCDIAAGLADVNAVAMGRRWGKTVLGGVLSLGVAKAGGYSAWFAPTYKNTLPLWRFAVAAAKPLVLERKATIRQSDRMIEFAGGGFVMIFSDVNADAARGWSFDLATVDEAARVSRETIDDVLIPTLADRGGKLLLISTPMGLNYFWELYMAGMAGDDDGIRSFTAPTWANPSPAIQRAVELARRRLPADVFRREFGAEFFPDSNAVFRNVAAAVARGASWQPMPSPDNGYVLGVDWGQADDWTTAMILDPARGLAFADRWRQLPYAALVDNVAAVADAWQVSLVAPEANGASALIEQLEARGLPVAPFTTTAASKAAAVQGMALALERDRFDIAPAAAHPWLIGELTSFTTLRLPSGQFRYTAPKGMHDDGVMGAAIGWYTAEQGALRFDWL